MGARWGVGGGLGGDGSSKRGGGGLGGWGVVGRCHPGELSRRAFKSSEPSSVDSPAQSSLLPSLLRNIFPILGRNFN